MDAQGPDIQMAQEQSLFDDFDFEAAVSKAIQDYISSRDTSLPDTISSKEINDMVQTVKMQTGVTDSTSLDIIRDRAMNTLAELVYVKNHTLVQEMTRAFNAILLNPQGVSGRVCCFLALMILQEGQEGDSESDDADLVTF